MTRLKIFFGIVRRHDSDGYGGWYGLAHAWQMSGILARYADDWRRIE